METIRQSPDQEEEDEERKQFSLENTGGGHSIAQSRLMSAKIVHDAGRAEQEEPRFPQQVVVIKSKTHTKNDNSENRSPELPEPAENAKTAMNVDLKDFKAISQQHQNLAQARNHKRSESVQQNHPSVQQHFRTSSQSDSIQNPLQSEYMNNSYYNNFNQLLPGHKFEPIHNDLQAAKQELSTQFILSEKIHLYRETFSKKVLGQYKQ
jgi:hypothetical protein